MANSEWRVANGKLIATAALFATPYSPFAHYAAIFTYSKSPGLLSMPTLGGEIHGA